MSVFIFHQEPFIAMDMQLKMLEAERCMFIVRVLGWRNNTR